MNPPLARFLRHALVFLLPLAAASLALDAFITRNLKRSGEGELGIWNAIYAGSIHSDIVVYGTSRAVGQFDPRILSERLHLSAYNLGMQGNNFLIQSLRHETLLRHDSRPRLILQSVEPFTFLKRKDPYDPEQFLPYLLEDPYVEAATAGYRSFDYWDRHLPAVRYFGKVVKLIAAAKISLRGPEPPERSRGYKTLDLVWNGNSERARRYWTAQHLVPDAEAMDLFDRYLAQCRANRIQVVLVNPPEYVDTREFIPHRAEISAFVKRMGAKHGVAILDYSENWMTDKPHLFSDALHLNTRGVPLFNDELAADLQPLIATAGDARAR